MSRSLKAHLLLVVITLVWGATFVVVKSALTEFSPLVFNAARMLLAAICLGIFFRRHLSGIHRATFHSGLLVGLFLFGGYTFQTTGLKLTAASKSAFLTGISIVLVPVFMALFWKRKINRWTAAGVAAAMIGLVLITLPGGSALSDLSSMNRGDFLTLACAVCFAFHIIFLGRFTQPHSFQQIAFLQVATAAVLMLATIPLSDQLHATWSPGVIAAIVVTGVLATAVAFTVQTWAQQFTSPTHTALILALEPVFALVTSYIVLGERLGARAACRATLILAGVLLSELKGTVIPVGQDAIPET